MVSVAPPAARELLKRLVLPRQGHSSSPSELTASGRSLFAELPMAPRFFTILSGRNLPKIRQSREPEPSTINEKTIADFTQRG